jgi:hypothetical protein
MKYFLRYKQEEHLNGKGGRHEQEQSNKGSTTGQKPFKKGGHNEN